MWEFFATFAGPIATVVASVAAGVITYRFGNIQAGIARSQAATAEAQVGIAQGQFAIAYDKLKHDLFEKRYAVYVAAKELIETIFGHHERDPKDVALKSIRLRLDEARFFFSPDTRAFCEAIEQSAKKYLTAEIAITGFSDEHPGKEKCRQQIVEAQLELVTIYEQLTDRFERDLRFEQLTKIPKAPKLLA